MARRRAYRRRVSSWFGRGRKNPAKKIALVNIFAAALAVLGIGVPVGMEAYGRWKLTGNFWDGLKGAGDMLSVLFLGRDMTGTVAKSGYAYQGWYIVAGSLGIVAVNRLLRMFAGRIPVWGRFTVN
jgi:hypothetical protein